MQEVDKLDIQFTDLIDDFENTSISLREINELGLGGKIITELPESIKDISDSLGGVEITGVRYIIGKWDEGTQDYYLVTGDVPNELPEFIDTYGHLYDSSEFPQEAISMAYHHVFREDPGLTKIQEDILFGTRQLYRDVFLYTWEAITTKGAAYENAAKVVEEYLSLEEDSCKRWQLFSRSKNQRIKLGLTYDFSEDQLDYIELQLDIFNRRVLGEDIESLIIHGFADCDFKKWINNEK